MKLSGALLAGALAAAPLAVGAADARTTRCFLQTAQAFDIPPMVLLTVAKTEGCWNGFVGKNDNGSVDRGLMCVNSIHDSRFAAYGITAEQLRDDACVSIAAGATLLRDAYRKEGTWAGAIGRYHSATPRYKQRYQKRAAGVLRTLLAKVEANRQASAATAPGAATVASAGGSR